MSTVTYIPYKSCEDNALERPNELKCALLSNSIQIALILRKNNEKVYRTICTKILAMIGMEFRNWLLERHNEAYSGNKDH